MDLQPPLHRGVDVLEEPQHVGGGVALVVVGEDLTRGDVQRGEQVERAVALVVMGHRAGPARSHRRAGLGPVQGVSGGVCGGGSGDPAAVAGRPRARGWRWSTARAPAGTSRRRSPLALTGNEARSNSPRNCWGRWWGPFRPGVPPGTGEALL